MTPIEFLYTLRKHWVTVVAVSLLGAVIGFAAARITPESFKSTSSVFVSTQRGETSAELVQGSTFTQNIVQSYSQLATMPVVLDPVIARLRLSTTAAGLAESVKAETPLNTFIIEITVTDGTAQGAADIANAITDELSTVVQRISPRNSTNVPVVELEHVARATPAAFRSSPNTPLLLATGGGAGLVLGYVFVLLRAVLDTRIRTEEELRSTGDIPVLGVIGRQAGGRGAATPLGGSEPVPEDYRRLAANIEFLDPDTKINSITVTSSMPGEGKTTTAIRLALAAGELTPRVLIVDADLRRPSVAGYCGIEGAVGLTSVLAGHVSLEDAVQTWGHIHVLTAGSLPPNPRQIVNSNAMAELMGKMTSSYDFVVVDSPPLLPVTDSLALARITDGALLVVRFKLTRRQQFQSSVASLDAVKARAIGVVLNRVAQRKRDAEYVYGNDPAKTPWEKLRTALSRPSPTPRSNPEPKAKGSTANGSGPGIGSNAAAPWPTRSTQDRSTGISSAKPGARPAARPVHGGGITGRAGKPSRP